MLRFLLAYSVVFVPLFVWSTWQPDPWFFSGMGTGHLAALLVGVPCLCAWVVAEAIERLRPRRVFDPRVHRGWALVISGWSAALLSVLLATPMIVLLDDKAPDSVLLGAASVAGSLSVLFTLGRKRRGECVHCGYDLSGAVDPRCPECGAMYSVVK